MFKTILIVLAVTIISLIIMAVVDKITTEITEEGGEVLIVSDPEGIEVTLSGEVELAGTYLLPVNSTLADAIKAAGGVTSNADSKCYETSFVLDGDMAFYIAPIYDSTDACSSSPIDKACINSADKATLLAKTSLSESQSQALINYRSEHGSFHRLEEIQNVSGIGAATWEKNKKYISLAV